MSGWYVFSLAVAAIVAGITIWAWRRRKYYEEYQTRREAAASHWAIRTPDDNRVIEFSKRLEATHREAIASMLRETPGSTAGRTEITAVTTVTFEDDEGEICHTRVSTSQYPEDTSSVID